MILKGLALRHESLFFATYFCAKNIFFAKKLEGGPPLKRMFCTPPPEMKFWTCMFSIKSTQNHLGRIWGNSFRQNLAWFLAILVCSVPSKSGFFSCREKSEKSMLLYYLDAIILFEFLKSLMLNSSPQLSFSKLQLYV